MSPEQLKQMIKWLNLQIMHLTESIEEAHQTNNYGREVQYKGMLDAFNKFLIKFTGENGNKKSIKNNR